MLKKLSIFAFLFATLIGFSSCGGDDDEDDVVPAGGSSKSELVGTWDVDKTIYVHTYGNSSYEEVEEDCEDYWVFTEKKVTHYDSSDLLNGKAMDYTYNKSKKQIIVPGLFTYDVVSLTSSSMIMKSKVGEDDLYSQEVTVYLHKRK